MRIGRGWLGTTLGVALVAGWALLTGPSGPTARAEDPPAEARPGKPFRQARALPKQTYDLRVVRIESDPSATAVGPWGQSGAVTHVDWPRALEVLAKRSAEGVELLLDQRIAAVPGKSATLQTSNTYPILRLDSQEGGKEKRRFDRIDTGVSLDLKTLPTFEYRIQVKWVHWPPTHGAVPTASTTWQGSLHDDNGSAGPTARGTFKPQAAPALRPGETLVLFSAQQIRNPKGERVRTEIYAFLTRHDR